MKIRSFADEDEPGVLRVWRECGLIAPQNDPVADIRRKLRVNPEWFLVGEIDGEVVAACMAGYEGHRGWINYLGVLPRLQRSGIAAALMAEAERLLRGAGCPKINLQVRTTNSAVIAFYQRLGYATDSVTSLGKRLITDLPRKPASEIRRQRGESEYRRGEPAEDATQFGDTLLPPAPAAYLRQMQCFEEARVLVSVGLDHDGRDAFLEPETAGEWKRMREAARDDGLVLLLISGFRSRAYQAGIVARKLAAGMALEDILRVSAYPGRSEHHTGRAIDIGCPACSDLTEQFEETQAFRWLEANAGRFGFSLSYPRGNPDGIVYEPWHWCHIPPAE